jgi:hypothetical protein
VRKIEFVVHDPVKDRMLQWIKNTGQIVEAGDDYRDVRDERTADLIGMYFADMGRRAGVMRTVDLNYRTGTADLTYRITIGPDMVPMRAMPPFNPECNVPISSFNASDVDDYVPLNLVDKMTRTHAFGCFDTGMIASDQQWLRTSNLFREASFDVQDQDHAKDVSLHLRGKPFKVKEVHIVGYGLFSDNTFPNDTGLPLKAGDTYHRSAAHSTREYLKGKYARANKVVDVFEDDQLTDDKVLVVTFQVLGYEQSQVLVNGREFRIDTGNVTEY